MKFSKAIDLWAAGVQEAIMNGTLKLQRGQWVICGDSKHKSRWVGIRGSSLWVSHWKGNGSRTRAAFIDLCNAAKAQ